MNMQVVSLIALLLTELSFGQATVERRKGVFDTPRGVVELDYAVIDGQAIFEGDILLPDAPEPAKGQRGGAATASIGQLWPYGIVPYEIPVPPDPGVTAAIQQWQSLTPLRFVAVRPSSSVNRLRFVVYDGKGDCGGVSGVGMKGGVQNVSRVSGT